jgi:NADH-quinone oxidoreductase subunit J
MLTIYIKFCLIFLITIGIFYLIISTSLIHNILTLIVLYLLIASYIIWNGLELIGFLLMMIYIGALAMIFLFVLMLVNISVILELAKKYFYLYHFTSVIMVLLCQYVIYYFCSNFDHLKQILYTQPNIPVDPSELGFLLYSENCYVYVLLIGLILLIILIGIIILLYPLTFEKKK